MYNKILIFTGKGGVGKTSVATAHAVKAAREGLKTLIVSTDMAHNLADIFQCRINEIPVEIDENLWGLELDPNYEMGQRYESIKKAILNMMNLDDKSEETFEDIVVFPGMEEIFSLLRIKEIYEEGKFDLIIIDCAPTGETLSMLKFPELLKWVMEKYLPLGRKVLKFLRPVSKAVFKIEIPSDETINDMEKLFILLLELQYLLKNRMLCSIRIVTVPERMIIEETKRSYMYLNLYGYNVDGIYINRIIPAEVENRFFDKWKNAQAEYIKEIEDAFFGVPQYGIKWYETDINGIPGLERLAKDSLADPGVLEIKEIMPSQQFIKTGEGYRFEVKLPFSGAQDFDLYESGTDLIIKIGNFKRNIPYPDSLRNFSICNAKFADECLSVYFNQGAN